MCLTIGAFSNPLFLIILITLRIPYHRALELANEYNIMDRVRPLFVENPSELVSWEATARYNRLPASSNL